MNDTLSELVEELRLISDEDFQFTQYAIKGRIQNRYAWRHESDNAWIPEGQTKTSVYGATLLAGILSVFGFLLLKGEWLRRSRDRKRNRPQRNRQKSTEIWGSLNLYQLRSR